MKQYLEKRKEEFEQFYWEEGNYKGRERGITGYLAFLEQSITEAFELGIKTANNIPVSDYDSDGDRCCIQLGSVVVPVEGKPIAQIIDEYLSTNKEKK